MSSSYLSQYADVMTIAYVKQDLTPPDMELLPLGVFGNIALPMSDLANFAYVEVNSQNAADREVAKLAVNKWRREIRFFASLFPTVFERFPVCPFVK